MDNQISLRSTDLVGLLSSALVIGALAERYVGVVPEKVDPIHNVEQAQVLPYNVAVTPSGSIELIPKVGSDLKTIPSQFGIGDKTYGCLSFMKYSGRVSLENCTEDQIWNWNPDSKIAISPTDNSGPKSMEVVVQGYLIDEFLDGEGKDVTGKATILRKDKSLLLYVR